jgi:hypothetical protein
MLDLGGGMAGLADGYQLLEHEKSLLGSIGLVLHPNMQTDALCYDVETLSGYTAQVAHHDRKCKK